MIAIIDYDAGNLKSVEKALAALGEEAAVTRDAGTISGADGVILPGVGAFGDAMEKLRQLDAVAYVRYASVYRSFKDISSFMSELQSMMEKKEAEQKK